jgi:hypothetical protein
MKVAVVTMVTRDTLTNDPTGYTSIEAQTPDEGQTVIMGIGNLPGIATAIADDITVIVQTLNPLPPRTVASLVEDYETGLQTITFNDP